MSCVSLTCWRCTHLLTVVAPIQTSQFPACYDHQHSLPPQSSHHPPGHSCFNIVSRCPLVAVFACRCTVYGLANSFSKAFSPSLLFLLRHPTFAPCVPEPNRNCEYCSVLQVKHAIGSSLTNLCACLLLPPSAVHNDDINGIILRNLRGNRKTTHMRPQVAAC